MFKYLGQHIFDFVSKFRNDVYFQNLEELDQNFSIVVGPDGKLSKSKSPAEKSIIEVRNDEGSVIPAGTPLYSKGEIGGSDRIKVGICDANDPAKMPCIGIAQAEMNTSDTKDNFAITQGVYNTNISGFTGLSEGDTLYVNGGSAPYLTSTKPSNGNYIQNVGIVLKTNGTICQGLLVSAIGRTNDVPWPLYVDVPNSRVGIGTTSPSYKLDVFGTSLTDAINTNVGFNISRVEAPDLSNTTATLATGTELPLATMHYSITYYNAIGETERGGFVSILPTSGNQRVQLNNLPISSDSSVIGRKIYRNKSTDSSSYGALVATIADNTTTSYLDSLPESDPVFSGHVFSRSIWSLANTTTNFISVDDVRSMVVDPNLTVFGYNAGQDITRAGASTLIGANAGANITYGSGNTLLGYNAGVNITTGAQNTLLGDSAGSQTLSTGSFNVAIGTNTLKTNGSHNIAMGYYTGANLGSGSGNVLLGSYIAQGTTVNFSDSVIIGKSASTINGTSGQVNINNLIFGNKNTQVVGIGTTSPTHTLHIEGETKINTTVADGLEIQRSGTTRIMSNASSNNGGFVYTGNLGNKFAVGAVGNDFVIQDANYLDDPSGAERMRVTSAGNVGIGTTSPAAKLDVHGTISQTVDAATNQYPLSFYNSHAGTNFYLLRQRVVNTGNQVRTGLGVTGVPSCALELGTQTDQILRFTTSGTIDNVSTINGNNPLKINATEIRTGDTSGSVGANFNIVGDNNRVPLGIKQQAGTSQTRFISFLSSSGDEVMGITTDGGFYVRDSTLVKRYVFDHDFQPTQTDGMSVGFDFRTENQYGTLTTFGYIDVTNDDITLQESSMRLSVGETTPTEIMRLESGGNVGIGTTSPTEKLEVSGNIKASGTIKGKMEQMFACSFSDDLGTTKHYLSFTSNAEQTNVHADQAAMVMPYNGRVKAIQLRLSNIDADTIRTFGIETISPGINMYQNSNNWTIEETESYELAATDDFYLVNYVFSNTSHFESGDLLAISIQDAEDAYTASRQTYVTVIIEYDLNNGMGNDTATTKYTS